MANSITRRRKFTKQYDYGVRATVYQDLVSHDGASGNFNFAAATPAAGLTDVHFIGKDQHVIVTGLTFLSGSGASVTFKDTDGDLTGALAFAANSGYIGDGRESLIVFGAGKGAIIDANAATVVLVTYYISDVAF